MANATKPRCDWLLIANGTPLSAKKLQALASNKKVMVLDGAYNYVKQLGIKIDVLLGDFDSIGAENLAQARKTTIEIIHTPDQSKTDLEKALDYIDTTQPASITICAATGRRLQHAVYNLRILKKYYQPSRPLTMLSDTEVIRYYQDTDVIVSGRVNDAIGIVGFPQAVITTSGLKYEVTDQPLEFEKYNNVLNELAREQAQIEIRGAALIIHEVVPEVDAPKIW